jgi:DNA adenine methylase
MQKKDKKEKEKEVELSSDESGDESSGESGVNKSSEDEAEASDSTGEVRDIDGEFDGGSDDSSETTTELLPGQPQFLSEDDVAGVKFVAPPIKWVGGKTQLMNKLMTTFPTKIANYYEIFLGGGSVLLGLLSCRKAGLIEVTGEIHVYDLNPHLISMYNNIRDNPKSLISKVKKYKKELKSCEDKNGSREPKNKRKALKSEESYYYWIRGKFNNMDENTSVKASARMIFLNKTGFRGLYREGPNGLNVPFGNYKNPGIIDGKDIKEISKLIRDVHFHVKTFPKSMKIPNVGDFVYMDPPYVPIKTTAFTGYTEKGFTADDHKLLFKMCHSMKDRGVQFVMSNAAAKVVTKAFKIYDIEEIECRRSINSAKPGSKAMEVIIRSY